MGVNCSNGELHYILEESPNVYISKLAKNLDEVEAKKITKNEASKPLFIAREE